MIHFEYLCLIFLYLTITIHVVVCFDHLHIFSARKFCTIKFDSKELFFTDELLIIEKSNFRLQFSLCNTNRNHISIRHQRTTSVFDIGSRFIPAVLMNGVYSLTSLDGAQCSTKNKNYTLTINFECSNTQATEPRLISYNEPECDIKISVKTSILPNCPRNCTALIENRYFIDLRGLSEVIRVISSDRTFSLTLCGSNDICGSPEISACELSGNQSIPLATRDSQYINYNVNKNLLSIKGRYSNANARRELEVFIKCNWTLKLGNARYKAVQKQGKFYKFYVESVLGCVKLPHDCVVWSFDNLKYNMSGLYRPSGFWEVANVNQGRILLNICGPLEGKYVNDSCAEEYSQVCHIENGKFTNKGSILSSIEVIDDVITAVIESGAVCNNSQVYSTQIRFYCSSVETGPLWKTFADCITYLEWGTRLACPINHIEGSDCRITDWGGFRDLNGLWTEKNTVHVLAVNPKVQLRYNICGPLHDTCNTFNNVSFCLEIEQNRQAVIGWDSRKLISDNGLLKMELTGDLCPNRLGYGKVIITFICSHAMSPPPPKIETLVDDCHFNISLFTPLACLHKSVFQDCVVNNGQEFYDLSPLILRETNYIVQDNEHNDYLLNICGPLTTDPNAFCKGNSMVCLRNNSEWNLKYRSLGEIAKPSLVGDNLMIEAPMGKYVKGIDYSKSRIYFECSARNELPKFRDRNLTLHNFIWRTTYACPKIKNCVVTSTNSDHSIDFNHLKRKKFQISAGNETAKYEFDFCKNIYKYNNGAINLQNLQRVVYYERKALFLKFDMQKKCDPALIDSINAVILKLVCNSDETGQYFEETSLENCVLNMIFKTHIVCSFKYNSKQEHSVVENEILKIDNVEPLSYENTNCFVISYSENNLQFNLSNLQSSKVFFGGSQYSINFNGELEDCAGLLCINSDVVVPISKMCPNIMFMPSDSSINLQYFTSTVCSFNESYYVEIFLKCTESTDGVVVQRHNCNVRIELSVGEICPLFKQNVTSSGAFNWLYGIGIGIVIIVMVGIFVLVCFHRLRSCFSKTSVPVYVYQRNLEL